MSNKPTKKLRDGPVIEVDPQIIRWRQRLRKEGIAIGREMRNNARRVKSRREDRELERAGGIAKKKWF